MVIASIDAVVALHTVDVKIKHTQTHIKKKFIGQHMLRPVRRTILQ